MSISLRGVLPSSRYFFTVRLQDHSADLLTRHIDLLRHAVKLTQQVHPLVIEDTVILPNRIHTIWSLPPGDDDYGVRWQMIKTTFARHVPVARVGRASPRIWQRRYWEQRIETEAEYASYAEMIADAPVIEGLAKSIDDWPYATRARPGWDKALAG